MGFGASEFRERLNPDFLGGFSRKRRAKRLKGVADALLALRRAPAYTIGGTDSRTPSENASEIRARVVSSLFASHHTIWPLKGFAAGLRRPGCYRGFRLKKAHERWHFLRQGGKSIRQPVDAIDSY
jgi:hypothetical protein